MTTYTGKTAKGAEYTMTSPTQIALTVAGKAYRGGVALKGTTLEGIVSHKGRATQLQAELTADEAQALAAWIAQTAAELAATPEAIALRLRDERANLVAAIPSYMESQRVFDRAWERGDEMEAFSAKRESDDRITEARRAAKAALAEFDAAHPEIKSAIDAEQAAATERATWN